MNLFKEPDNILSKESVLLKGVNYENLELDCFSYLMLDE